MNIRKFLLLLALMLAFGWAEAHPLPQCKAQLIVNEKNVLIHFKGPVEIIELAQKNNINFQSKASLDSLKSYFLNHISIEDTLKSEWEIKIGKIERKVASDLMVGNYPELNLDIYLVPSNPNSTTNFTMYSDWVIHQIPTQSIIFSIEQDWQNGIVQANGTPIGVLAVDIPTGKIYPLTIKLESGSWWKGFKAMVWFGSQHIAEGTDHLLFLLVLLLPAVQLVSHKKWHGMKTLKQSFWAITKIVTAFTIGHSLTLLLGALDWITVPQQPIEIAIVFSILISAVHAIYPIFPNREAFVALFFGLIHGLAFAYTLHDLELSTPHFLLSILGFNLGVELFQLLVIAIVLPILLVLSHKTNIYPIIRILGAILSIMASLYWLNERI